MAEHTEHVAHESFMDKIAGKLHFHHDTKAHKHEHKVEPEKEKVLEQHKVEPEKEKVLEQHKVEPEKEKVLEQHKVEPEKEKVLEQHKVEPETEKVLEQHKVEPEKEKVLEQHKVEPETEKVLEQHKVEPEKEKVLEQHKEKEKEKEKIKEDSSSSSSSDDESEKVKPVSSPAVAAPSAAAAVATSSAGTSVKDKVSHLFGRQKPVYQVLGGGKPAEVFLWRNKKISASVLGTATVIWILFELLEYHLLSLVCHVLIFGLAVLFLWSNATNFINKSPPQFPEFSVPEQPFLQVAAALRFELNRVFALFHDIAIGKDLKKFLAVIAGLWLLSIVGKSCDFLTLFYINFVLLHTVPVLYEKHEDKVDAFAERAFAESKKHYGVVNERYISKIPRGPWSKKSD